MAKVLELQLQQQSFQWIFRDDFLQDELCALLAVQGTLRSLLQQLISKASVLQLSAFFTVQLSHPYMTTGKPIALTRQVTTFILRIQESVQLHLFICFVFQLPNRSEVIWCMSFSVMSLRWQCPRSIRTVADGRISFFLWLSSIPLRIYTTLIDGLWLPPLSWLL